MSTFLIVVACVIFLIAFVDYNSGMFKGKNMPAFTAWFLFSIITVVNVVMNLSFTAKWTSTLLLATDWFTCVGTSAFVVLRTRGRVRVDKKDKQIAALSAMAIVLWIIFKSSVVGVGLNQIAYSLAFIPTLRNVRRNPLDEPARPWLVWAGAFVIDLVAIRFDPTTVSLDYVTPVVCLVWHTTIGLLSLLKKK